MPNHRSRNTDLARIEPARTDLESDPQTSQQRNPALVSLIVVSRGVPCATGSWDRPSPVKRLDRATFRTRTLPYYFSALVDEGFRQTGHRRAQNQESTLFATESRVDRSATPFGPRSQNQESPPFAPFACRRLPLPLAGDGRILQPIRPPGFGRCG